MTDIKDFVIEDGVLTEYKGNGGAVVIPDGVTSIGDEAFYDCKKLSSINIPDSVTSIGDDAFWGCENLTTITIPDSITSIGWGAFDDCTNLTTITIPDSVTIIGNHAFYNCENLTTITIPDGVTSIGDKAFYGCSNLTTINIPDSVTSIGYDAFLNSGYHTNFSNWENDVLYIGNHLIKVKATASGEFVIKPGTKTIAGGAFYDCKKLSSINIPDNVTSISDGAFSYCSNLTTINIPDSITSIGDYTFSNCTNLTTINIPESVTSIGRSAFHYCKSLTTISIPYSVTSIGNTAFDGCESLTSITIPKSVTHIYESNDISVIVAPHIKLSDYNDVIRKRSLTLGFLVSTDLYSDQEVVKEYSKYAKKEFVKIIEFVVKNDLSEAIKTYITLGKITSLNAEGEILKLAEMNNATKCMKFLKTWISSNPQSEGNKDSITEVKTLSVTEMKKMFGFYEKEDGTLCIYSYKLSLCGVDIPPIIGKQIVSEIGCNKKGNPFDFGYLKEVNLTLPDTVTSIGDNAFLNCKSLVAINIPNGVTYIGDGAFGGCTNLKTINIPDSVTSIGSGAFKGCTNLKDDNGFVILKNTLYDYIGSDNDVVIPCNVTSIDYKAFAWCSNLATINIPDNVTNIGSGAFKGCRNLKDDNGFVIVKNTLYDYVGSDNHVAIPDNVTSICGDVFSWRSDIETITIPESVTSIDEGAFSGCENLTTITIPDSVTSIGESAFFYCENLTTITIPESVTSIGESAFSYCKNLTIHAHAGSYAEQYAKKNKINFVAE